MLRGQVSRPGRAAGHPDVGPQIAPIMKPKVATDQPRNCGLDVLLRRALLGRRPREQERPGVFRPRSTGRAEPGAADCTGDAQDDMSQAWPASHEAVHAAGTTGYRLWAPPYSVRATSASAVRTRSLPASNDRPPSLGSERLAHRVGARPAERGHLGGASGQSSRRRPTPHGPSPARHLFLGCLLSCPSQVARLQRRRAAAPPPASS